MVITKSLFLPSVLIWRKTRKRKPWTLSFIEEAWICRTGATFQRFSVKRRQAWSDCEARVTLERSEKNLCPGEQAQFSAFFRQTEARRKRSRRVSHARKEEYKKKEGKTSCTLYLHQFFKLLFPQTPAETTANMVLCRGNIFSKEMTVTSKHMLLCERNL